MGGLPMCPHGTRYRAKGDASMTRLRLLCMPVLILTATEGELDAQVPYRTRGSRCRKDDPAGIACLVSEVLQRHKPLGTADSMDGELRHGRQALLCLHSAQ